MVLTSARAETRNKALFLSERQNALRFPAPARKRALNRICKANSKKPGAWPRPPSLAAARQFTLCITVFLQERTLCAACDAQSSPGRIRIHAVRPLSPESSLSGEAISRRPRSTRPRDGLHRSAFPPRRPPAAGTMLPFFSTATRCGSCPSSRSRPSTVPSCGSERSSPFTFMMILPFHGAAYVFAAKNAPVYHCGKTGALNFD